MKFEEMSNLLGVYFPNLKQVIDAASEEDKEYYKIGSYILYGEVFNPYIRQLLLEEENPEEIEHVFDFLEKMAICEDQDVRNLLQVEILEFLWGKETHEKAFKYMHSYTKQIYNKIEVYFNIPTKEKPHKSNSLPN
ncbi:MAG TPA: hypothetical protein PK629_04335 [Oscillospiraceae bacterium]|nr:hypothetical protein [Oscillospiraceae bacterium]HPK35154.1 hypothetical protein [Oscillospiraceae bacterium]HPR74957.1 hypothetical protein [Oscillospiraceae bacterium]